MSAAQSGTTEELKQNHQDILSEINRIPVQYIIDEAAVGLPIELAKTDWKLFDGVADRAIANQYAASTHPIIKLPRVIVWLMKLEEIALVDGNVKALEILLDRAFGKVTESLAIGVGNFDTSSDGDLLKELKTIRDKIN